MTPPDPTDRDRLSEALSAHRAIIVEADEWRPIADHVLALMGRAEAEGYARGRRAAFEEAAVIADERQTHFASFATGFPIDPKRPECDSESVANGAWRCAEGIAYSIRAIAAKEKP